jgi:hypothetical protein
MALKTVQIQFNLLKVAPAVVILLLLHLLKCADVFFLNVQNLLVTPYSLRLRFVIALQRHVLQLCQQLQDRIRLADLPVFVNPVQVRYYGSPLIVCFHNPGSA